MSKAERIPVYLQHILDAIERASTYVAPFQSAADFASNTQAPDAVVRNLEILGEAVNKINQVDGGYLQGHPGVPWQLMRAMAIRWSTTISRSTPLWCGKRCGTIHRD